LRASEREAKEPARQAGVARGASSLNDESIDHGAIDGFGDAAWLERRQSILQLVQAS